VGARSVAGSAGCSGSSAARRSCSCAPAAVQRPAQQPVGDVRRAVADGEGTDVDRPALGHERDRLLRGTRRRGRVAAHGKSEVARRVAGTPRRRRAVEFAPSAATTARARSAPSFSSTPKAVWRNARGCPTGPPHPPAARPDQPSVEDPTGDDVVVASRAGGHLSTRGRSQAQGADRGVAVRGVGHVQRGQLVQGVGCDAVPAGLVTGEAGLVQQQHPRRGSRSPRRQGGDRARGTATHHDDVPHPPVHGPSLGSAASGVSSR